MTNLFHILGAALVPGSSQANMVDIELVCLINPVHDIYTSTSFYTLASHLGKRQACSLTSSWDNMSSVSDVLFQIVFFFWPYDFKFPRAWVLSYMRGWSLCNLPFLGKSTFTVQIAGTVVGALINCKSPPLTMIDQISHYFLDIIMQSVVNNERTILVRVATSFSLSISLTLGLIIAGQPGHSCVEWSTNTVF